MRIDDDHKNVWGPFQNYITSFILIRVVMERLEKQMVIGNRGLSEIEDFHGSIAYFI